MREQSAYADRRNGFLSESPGVHETHLQASRPCTLWSGLTARIDGKKVSKVGEVEVRSLPEGAVFSPDGKWLYIGNFLDSDISVLRVDGDNVTNTGTLLKLSNDR